MVIVPSISETRIKSVWSQTKILAVAAIAPVADREKVIELAPDWRTKAFYGRRVQIIHWSLWPVTHKLIRGKTKGLCEFLLLDRFD